MNRYGISLVNYSQKSEKNKFFRTIGFIFLTLILSVFAAPSVSAEGYNVLNTDFPVLELETELYSSPDTIGNNMNSLPAKNEAQKVNRSTLTDDVNSTSLTENINDTILISLTENPTTGYSWKVTNSTGLEIISDEYVSDNAAKGMAGVGGVHIWTVKPVETGKKSFTAVMMHIADEPTSEEKTNSLNVTVTGIAKEPVEDIQSNNPTAKNSVI